MVNEIGDIPYDQGETCAIRGGGPLMTVFRVSESVVNCLWFDVHGHVQTLSFPKRAVVKLSLEEYPDSPYNSGLAGVEE